MTFAQALILDFGTLTMISRYEPFMAAFYFAGIVDELLLCAAIVHLIFGTVGRLPQCISAHNFDTETILRLMSFLDPYIGSTKRSLLSSDDTAWPLITGGKPHQNILLISGW